jgi:succinate-acetate transporter protein
VDDGKHPHPHAIARIFVRPIGSALPLGFFAFGLGMFMLGGMGTELVSKTDAKHAALVLVAFVFPLELVATIVAFLARDTLGATALGLFTTSWLTFGVAVMTGKPGATSGALGLFELFFAGIVVLLSIVAWQGKPLIAGILTVSAARAALAGVYELDRSKTIDHVAGWMGFGISGLALYGGLAFLLEDAGRVLLPVLRRGEAHTALEGSLADQLERIESEAGVRQQL